MKQKKTVILIGFLAFFMAISLPACKTGEGCAYNLEYNENSKGGKSNLFSKKTRKKMKKRGQ